MRIDLTRRQWIGVAVGGLALLVVVLVAVGVFAAPSVADMTNEWGEVDEDRIEVRTQLTVDNPNPLPLGYGVDGANYTLAMNQIAIAEGSVDGIDLPRGEGTLDLRTYLLLERVPPWWASHVRNDETSEVDIEARVHVSIGPLGRSPPITHSDTIQTDLEGTLAEALEGFEGEHHGPMIDLGVTSTRPTVEVTDTNASWGAVDEASTEVLFDVTVHNPNAYPIPTPAFTGGLEFNDVAIGAWDAHDVDLVRGPADGRIPPDESRDLRYAVTIDNERIATWFATHVDREERSDARMTGQLALRLSGHTMTIPPDEEAIACTFDLRTAILVEQDSGVSNRTCAVAGVAPPEEEALEASGATLDLTETDWFDDLLGLDPVELAEP